MLIQRILTAAVLLPVFIGALFLLPNLYWAIFLLLVLLGAGLEWARLAGFSGAGTILYLALITACGGGLLALTYGVLEPGGLPAGIIRTVLWSGAAFWILAVPVWLFSGRVISERPVLLGAGWLVLVPCWLALVLLQREPGQLLVLMGIVWIADSAAYFAGKRFGRHKLAPTISPGKTWEGVAGALAAVTLYYALVTWGAAPGTFPAVDAWGFGLFLLIAVAAVFGDLYESRIKRQAGVKDSGSLLPGHGGILDRIDALTSSMPLAALAILYV
jgi:phosphatidate cytidylyltransferase